VHRRQAQVLRPAKIDRTTSGIFKNGRVIETSNLPPKTATAYAAASAATRTSWRIKPSRHPRTISKQTKTTPKEMKIACQRSEPATA
jgi:hypothetical protein